MSKKQALLIILCAIVSVVAITSALVIALVASTQNIESQINVEYNSVDAYVKISANYYIGSEGTAMINGSATEVVLSPLNRSGSLNQPSNEVVYLDVDKGGKVVYEYRFENKSKDCSAFIEQGVDSNGNAVVPKDAQYNNIKIEYMCSNRQLSPLVVSGTETFSKIGLLPLDTQYLYVIVSIVNNMRNASFQGSFLWSLGKGEVDNVVENNNIVFDDKDLINEDAVKNITFVPDAVNNEPNSYPMVKNKCFTGWYLDADYKNKAEFPLYMDANTKLYPKLETATSGLQYTYSNGKFVVSGYSGDAETIYIPDVYSDGTRIEELQELQANALNGSTAKEIVFPKTLKKIGARALYNCAKLQKLYIPENVEHIDGLTAGYNIALTDLKVDPKNSVYDSRDNCNAIIETATNKLIMGTDVTIVPDTVEILGNGCFYNSRMTKLNIPRGVKAIEDDALSAMANLSILTVSADNSVFDSRNNCNAIIKTATNSLFIGCKSTVIPISVTSIAEKAFYWVSGLTSITIPENIVTIEDFAFRGTGLISLYIPKSVTSIGFGITGACTKLTSIIVDPSNTVYESRSNCNAIVKIENSEIIATCNNTIVPQGILRIGYYAFHSSSLTSITIPSTVISIGRSAFDSCSKLTSIAIPDSVIEILGTAFSGCSSLRTVTLGKNVKLIGSGAFQNCTALTSVTFGTTTGWYATKDSSATSGTTMTVTNASTNASNLTGTYLNYTWKR